MDEESRQYLTLNTPKGLFAVNRLLFGIAPAIFQRILANVLKGLPSVICYLDDILITGRTQEEHLRNVAAVLKRLPERGIGVQPSKCDVFQDKLQYLGHVITKDGVQPTNEQLPAIVNARTPTNKQQLQAVVGLINYYGKFVQNLSSILFPLNKLLRKDAVWVCDKSCEKAFQQVKQMLATQHILAHYVLQIAWDASAYGVGAVLSHVFEDGQTHPVAYASRTLTKAELGYRQFEKEALPFVFGVKQFHFYVYARPFTLLTDHKPLETICGPNTGIPTIAAARLQRWAFALPAYTFTLKFRPSVDNVDAECLSRLPLQQSGVEGSRELFRFAFRQHASKQQKN